MKNIERRANSKLYMLRLLKRHNLPCRDLLTVYTCYVRPITDCAAPVWNGAITANQNMRLERIQKRALRIIFGKHYSTYENVLKQCNLPSLEDRRLSLCTTFIEKTMKHTDQFQEYMPPATNLRTLRKQKRVKEIRCKTKRMQNSSIPYLSRLYNNM